MQTSLHVILARIIPSWIYNRLIGDFDRNGFTKYFQNTGWMFIARLVSFITSFITIIFVARYLGPENLGKISYAQSVISIFSMFASLGIDNIVYRDLIAHPADEKKILGTAIVTKIVFGVITFGAAVLTSLLLHGNDILTWLIATMALTFLFQPIGVVGLVFGARVLSKYSTLVAIVTALLIPLLKFVAIWNNQGILFFAAIIAFEAVLNGLLYVFLYKKILHGSLRSLSVSWLTFKKMTSESWPLMLVGFTGYLYARIDQVMIQHFIDSTSVGLYEAAVRLTEPLGFIPGVVMGSLFPALINARSDSHREYQKRYRLLVQFCLGISITFASIIFIAAPYLISFIYGPEYIQSVAILRIYVWSTVGTIATALLYTKFIAENRTYLQLIFTASGAILNIVLNLVMIPRLGITGAAYATLVTIIIMLISFLLVKKIYA